MTCSWRLCVQGRYFPDIGGSPSNQSLLLQGRLLGSGALAWRLAPRVGIMLLQQKLKVVRSPGIPPLLPIAGGSLGPSP